MATLKHAVGLNPRLDFLHLHLADAYLELGRLEEARAEYELAVAAQPALRPRLDGPGGDRRARGQAAPRSAQVLRRAVDAGTDSALGLEPPGRGRAGRGRRRGRGAGRGGGDALVPEFAEAWFVRGEVAEKAGRLADAVARYEQAMSAGPGRPPAARAHRPAAAEPGAGRGP